MELRNDVESKIKSGVYKSMPNSNDKLSTLLWSVFDLISREDGSPIDGLVCCKRCQKVFRYDKKCTKNLTSHACFPILSTAKEDTGEETFHHVADKLKSGEYKLIQRTNGRSPVWSVFAQIQRSDGSIVKTAVHCCQCKKFYRYHSGQVSNLGRHKCVQLWKLQESMTKRRRTEEDNDLHVGSIFSEDSNISMEKEYEDEEEGEGEETTMDTTFNCVKEEFKESEFNDYNVLIGHNEETYPMDDGSLLRVINAVKEDEHHEETAYQSQSSPAPETDKECTLTRDILEENLRSGKYKLIEKPKARSSVWKMFSAIAKEDGSIIEQWVYCRRCKKVYRNSEKRASSNLIRHNCCSIVLKKISANDRKEIIEDFANWMIEDTQSVTVFEGGGFRKLADKFIKIGARYGVDMDVNDFLMPSPTAVRQSISQKAAEQKWEVKRKIEEFTRYATVSVDFWTDNNISRHFLSATLHYVRNFHVYTLALGVKSMDNTTTRNETTTQKKLMKLLTEFGIDDTTDLLFVVESRTNIEIGLEDRDTLKCSSSLFAQALDKAIQDTPHISEMITACKAIEKYFRKSSEQTSLLKSEANTRCKSQYRLFKLIASNWQTVKTSLESINIAKTSTFSLPALVDLLQKCEIIFKKLQEKHKPTLCYVIPSINRLKIICKATTDDSPQMKALKASLLLNLEEIWFKNINIWHKTAYFLYPPTNRAQENNLNEIKDFCIKQMNVFGSTSKDEEESASTTTTSYCEYESADIANNQNTDDIDFFFPDIPKRCRLTNNKTNNVEEEFRRYCLETVLIDANFDVCQWWRVNAPYYPLLSRLFSKISSIPASTTGIQYMYAVTAKIAEEKHRGLQLKNMEDIMFLNSIKPNKI